MEKLPFHEIQSGGSSKDLAQRIKIDSDHLSSLATNAGLIILCAIAAFVSFWDVRFTLDKAFTIGWVTVLLYITATTVYQTKYDGGVFRGRQTEQYKNTLKDFKTARAKVDKNSLIDNLRDWCNEFRIKDIEQVRKDIVCPYIKYEEYLQKYVNRSKQKINQLDLTPNLKKAINRANAIQPVELTPDMLLNSSFSKKLFGKRSILPRSGDTQRKGDFISNYVQRFVITFLCGMIVVQVISNPTFDTFLQWVIRMIPIVMAFLTGDTGGYRNATEVDTKRLDAQTRILEMLFSDEEKKTGREVPTPESKE